MPPTRPTSIDRLTDTAKIESPPLVCDAEALAAALVAAGPDELACEPDLAPLVDAAELAPLEAREVAEADDEAYRQIPSARTVLEPQNFLPRRGRLRRKRLAHLVAEQRRREEVGRGVRAAVR